ncbi:FkbM family methyltransferase [Candidatus Kaiserbacteria bacterium]|nr:FkbM family methyltransferase [Candidatus Kaiserbacteria bacterium]
MQKELLTKFQEAERRAQSWYEFSGTLGAKLRRILFLKGKYLVFTLYRLGLKKEGTAKLFFGKHMRLPLRDPNALRMYFMGTLGAPRERALTAFLIRTLKKDDVFYDIGANFGFYAFLAETLAGEVHAFEPNERIYAYLKKNAAKNIETIQMAVSNEVGMVTFFDSIEDSSSSSLIQSEDREAEEYASNEVKATTLDTYTKDHTPPTILKIDVEGAERLVLEGGKETLTTHKPTIILEVWGKERGKKHHKEAVSLLHTMGYVPHHITEDGTLERLGEVDFDGITRYENIVFTRPS